VTMCVKKSCQLVAKLADVCVCCECFSCSKMLVKCVGSVRYYWCNDTSIILTYTHTTVIIGRSSRQGGLSLQCQAFHTKGWCVAFQHYLTSPSDRFTTFLYNIQRLIYIGYSILKYGTSSSF